MLTKYTVLRTMHELTKKFLCSYYIQIGCPKVIRLDCGVENTLIGECQVAFRLNATDTLYGAKSVRFGSSPTNSVHIIITVIHMHYMHACIHTCMHAWCM